MDYIGCGGYINVQVILPTYASPDGTTLDSPEALDFIVEEDWGWSRNTAACINGAIPLTNTQAFPNQRVLVFSKIELPIGKEMGLLISPIVC